MILTYLVTEDDVVAFAEHHADHSPLIRRQLSRARYLAPLWFVFCGLVIWISIDRALFLILFSVVAVAWVLWWPRYWKRQYLKQTVRLYREGGNSNVLGEHEARLCDDGLVDVAASGQESKYPWRAIERIEQTPEYIFLYVSAVQAIVVPRQRIHEGNFEEFSRACLEGVA